jgi:hypothetical protein
VDCRLSVGVFGVLELLVLLMFGAGGNMGVLFGRYGGATLLENMVLLYSTTMSIQHSWLGGSKKIDAI